MPEEYLTVEEAARRLGVAPTTVRRRASAGLIDAVKSGRSWVIRGESLPPPTKRREKRITGTASALVDFPTALRQIRGQDLGRDVWVPDVLRFADDLADPAALMDAAAARVDETIPLDPAVSVPVPKSPIFLRNAVNLSLPDRLAYHAVVLALAPTIDALMTDEAYSARLDSGHRFLRTGGFARWKAAVRQRAEEVGGYVVETDLTAFFDCINHSLLMQEIRETGVPIPLANVLGRMLRTWAVAPNTGLPQGPDASRLLGNFYMRAVDDVMARIPDVSYLRYMDDVRIIAKSRHHAISALHAFDDECKKRNLVLSTKKTELKTAEQAIAALEDGALDDANYAFENDENSSNVRQSLSKLFRNALRKDGTVNRTHARFSLYRLYRLRERTVLTKVLGNLESVAGLGWNVAAYISPWVTSSRVAEGVADYLENPERNTGGYLASWLLAAFADDPSAATQRIINYARKTAFDLAQPSFQRAIALQVAALGRTPSDIGKLQAIIDKEYNPEVARAALVALRRIDRLDKATSDRAKRLPGMHRTIDYLRAHDDLPSILFGHRRAPRMR